MILGPVTFDRVDYVVSENDDQLLAAFGKLTLDDEGIEFEISRWSKVKDVESTSMNYTDITRVGLERFYIRTGVLNRQDWINVAVIEGRDHGWILAPLLPASMRSEEGEAAKYDEEQAREIVEEIEKRMGKRPRKDKDERIDISDEQKTRLFGMIKALKRIDVTEATEILETTAVIIKKMLFDLVGSGEVDGEFIDDHVFVVKSNVGNFIESLDGQFSKWEKKGKKDKI
jgi:hypothetical protein